MILVMGGGRSYLIAELLVERLRERAGDVSGFGETGTG